MAQAALNAAAAATRRPRPFHKFDGDGHSEFRVNGKRLASSETPPASATAAAARKRQNPFIVHQGHAESSGGAEEQPLKISKLSPSNSLQPTSRLNVPFTIPLPVPNVQTQASMATPRPKNLTRATAHFTPCVPFQASAGITAFHEASSYSTFQGSLAAAPSYLGISLQNPMPPQATSNLQLHEPHVLQGPKRSQLMSQGQAMQQARLARSEALQENCPPTPKAVTPLKKPGQRQLPNIEDIAVPPAWTTNDDEAPASMAATCRTLSSHGIVAGMTVLGNPTPLARLNVQQEARRQEDALTPVHPPATSKAEHTEVADATQPPTVRHGGENTPDAQQEGRIASDVSKDPAVQARTRSEFGTEPTILRSGSHDLGDWLVPTSTTAGQFVCSQLGAECRPEQPQLSRMLSNFSGNSGLSIGTSLTSFMNNILATRGETENGNELLAQAAIEDGLFDSVSPRRLPDFGATLPVVGSSGVVGTSHRATGVLSTTGSPFRREPPNDVNTNSDCGEPPAAQSTGPLSAAAVAPTPPREQPGVSFSRMGSNGSSSGTNSFLFRLLHAETYPLNPRAMDFETLLSAPPTSRLHQSGEDTPADAARDS